LSEAVQAARNLLASAIAERVFPAAAVEVGDHERVFWREALGTLTFEPGSARTDVHTIFDLASLTRPIVTTTLALQRVSARVLDLDQLVSAAFEEWRGGDRASVTIRDLLTHASGLPARLVDAPPQSRREFEHEIVATPLEYAPRERSVYSDLGFILLGFLIADRGAAALDVQFARFLERGGPLLRAEGEGEMRFTPPSAARARIAPTLPLDDDLRRGRLLVGEVHDNYAAALGGVAGHSGLFGNAAAVGRFAQAALRGARGDHTMPAPLAPPLIQQAIRRSSVPDSSRALGWDTMLPTSSCGTQLSFAAFGHVGFTGTSLWIDPILDRYFVLLTNRACGGGSLDEMKRVRRAFHDVAVGIDE
jgi:CubicO group peptidase (beta-lactamase class C family)